MGDEGEGGGGYFLRGASEQIKDLLDKQANGNVQS